MYSKTVYSGNKNNAGKICFMVMSSSVMSSPESLILSLIYKLIISFRNEYSMNGHLFQLDYSDISHSAG